MRFVLPQYTDILSVPAFTDTNKQYAWKAATDMPSLMGSMNGSAQMSTAYNIKKAIFFISVPPNGLMIFCGKVITPEGKEKMVNIDIEPFRAVNAGLYHCDNKFHTAVSLIRFV